MGGLLRGAVAGCGGACFALRLDAPASDGASPRATLFITDWTAAGSRAAAFELGDVMQELTDLYGAPPPPRGGEWERLQRALGRAGGALEAGADVATAALVTQHLHGHRAVDVRLPPGRAALSPVRLEEALAWMREMYNDSVTALERATRAAEALPAAAPSPDAAATHRGGPRRKRGAGVALVDGDALEAAASQRPASDAAAPTE